MSVPLAGQASAPAGAPPRPAPAAPRTYRFPRFEREDLGNGVQLFVAPVTKLPLVTTAVLMDAGAVCDPMDHAGLAQLTAKLLTEGANDSAGASLSERFERLGASVDARADWDVASVSTTVIREKLSPAIALLADVVRRPEFPQREVDRLKHERIAEVLQLRSEPRGLADEMFTRLVYTAESRYAAPDGGDERSVGGLRPSDVASFFRARYRPGGSTIVMTGDITVGEARAIVAEAFGDWAGGTPAPMRTTAAPARSTRSVHIVAKPDAPQSELRIGHVGITRRDPDYFAFSVMNAILGGLFSSRINLNLRERHGYTYGAFSGVDWRRQPGPFIVSTAVESESTAAATREVVLEIERMRSELVSPDELSLATSYLAGVFPIRYETTAGIAAALANLVIYELPNDYYDTYRDAVRAVTREAVLDAAQRHLHADALQTVVVGDPAVTAGSLRELDLGPVMIHDSSGALIADSLLP